jgi:transaldolase
MISFAAGTESLLIKATIIRWTESRRTDGDVLSDGGIVSGIDMVAQCVQILRYFGLEADVLAASLRNPRQVREAALAGADVATLPFDVIKDLLKHFKTYEGMEKFTADVVPEYADIMK